MQKFASVNDPLQRRVLFCSESVEEVGDLYLDVAEAYMDKGYYAECKPLLASLVDSEKYNLVTTLSLCNYTISSCHRNDTPCVFKIFLLPIGTGGKVKNNRKFDVVSEHRLKRLGIYISIAKTLLV